MGNYEIREPIQKRSIAKKEKIIETGFKLICDKGYYNINTNDIAKAANVSTGIVYQYFKDKHDILIDGIQKYADELFFPLINIPEDAIINKNDLKKHLKTMINEHIKGHTLSHNAHQEIMSMYYTDSEINEIFNSKELKMTNRITKLLLNSGFKAENIAEKVHLSINTIDNLCHEIVFHKHKDLDYDKMIDIVINFICNILR